nr:immunoglobulin heavy chain junction region [Macaca mulatta]MOX93688.1 immunoglobulin heavy chain junction region [Macaca mulatta]MOX93723.1 immunoglobulin heavy chain junction region [Macaca mulatta]MOX95750.1 immunoglobulin heavy chain junction region [Macaca mulatta]MOX96452.1 immunoglobulin heavy chain junction region [Macaca mulatta]
CARGDDYVSGTVNSLDVW